MTGGSVELFYVRLDLLDPFRLWLISLSSLIFSLKGGPVQGFQGIFHNKCYYCYCCYYCYYCYCCCMLCNAGTSFTDNNFHTFASLCCVVFYQQILLICSLLCTRSERKWVPNSHSLPSPHQHSRAPFNSKVPSHIIPFSSKRPLPIPIHSPFPFPRLTEHRLYTVLAGRHTHNGPARWDSITNTLRCGRTHI